MSFVFESLVPVAVLAHGKRVVAKMNPEVAVLLARGLKHCSFHGGREGGQSGLAGQLVGWPHM